MLKVRDTAAELLNLYAQRTLRKGHAFKFTYHDYEAFCAGFCFEETPDQAAAIQAVILDLQSGKPMDRLICGDMDSARPKWRCARPSSRLWTESR